MAKKYPKKGLASYIVPFLLILILVGSGVYILQNRVDFADVKQFFLPPEVAKDEKVTVVYQQGNNELKIWNEERWQILGEEAYLQAGDSIKTGEGSAIVLRFFEDSEIRIDKESELKLIRMDRDEIAGNHIAIELLSGQVWGRIMKSNTADGDFIINTPQQLVQLNSDTLINVSNNPETTRLIGGEAVINVTELRNGTRKPVARLNAPAGEQIVLDTLTLDQLKADERDVFIPLSEKFISSEWYLWNMDKEEKLGSHVTIVEVEPEKLEPLAEGLVTVTSHDEGEKIGGTILLQGSYDTEQIEKVYVNGLEATLGLSGDWEVSVPLSEQSSVVHVTAQEVGSDTRKEALSLTFVVDGTGPAFGAVTQPIVDENGNGTLDSDSLELIGEVSDDAVSVCVSHNDGSPYCLQQFAKGDTSYRYLGAVSYGNVVSGRNKYTITAKDSLGNTNTKTIYLFKDEAKPDSKIIDDTPTPDSSGTVSSILDIPVITDPDPSEVIQVTEKTLSISGTVDTRSRSLLINGKKADYTVGSPNFSIDYDLTLGENLIKIQTVDTSGSKSKTALLTVLYLEPTEEDEE